MILFIKLILITLKSEILLLPRKYIPKGIFLQTYCQALFIA